jgi:uncharacterized protein (TIGR02001 family)
MRKSILSLSVTAALLVPGLAAAQAAAPSPLTGNATLITDYRFRGISQTFGKPAFQGGFDYAHASGFYAGNWNSNVAEAAGYPGGNLEMDFYGGYKKAFGDLGLDAGLLYYYYPGTKAEGGGVFGPLVNPHSPTKRNSGTVYNTEAYLAGSWKWITVKWSYALSDYFSAPDTKGTNYLDLGAAYDVGGGWGVNGHVGRTSVHNFSEASYTDYKLGVTKDLSGWLLGASLVSTNAKHNCPNDPYCYGKTTGGTYDPGKSTIVLSVGKTF